VAVQNASSALVERGDSSDALRASAFQASASQEPAAQSGADLNVTPVLLLKTIIEAQAERLRASLAQSYQRVVEGSLKKSRAYGDLVGDGDLIDIGSILRSIRTPYGTRQWCGLRVR
jgi:hypothetical protein